MSTYAKYPSNVGGGGGSSDSFVIIQTDNGTAPTATSPTDVLTLTSSDMSVVITGDSVTNTVNFQTSATATPAFGVVAVPNGTDPTALVPQDTLTFTSTGNTVTITGDDATNTINLEAAASITTGDLTDAGTDGIVITGGTGAVVGSGTSIAQHVADSTHNGYLSSTDWSTFNNKQNTITPANLTAAGTDGIAVTGGTGAVLTAASIAQHVADSSHNGYLSSTDWSTFNGKQAAGNYITALTGDGSASGPGSSALTLATVNSNTGSFGDATHVGAFTVNGKGLITAASSTSIQIAESQVTNLTTDLAAKQSTTLTSAHILVGNGSNVATDVAASGDLTLANTGAFTVAKIQTTTVSGTTGSGNVVFSASPTLSGTITTGITASRIVVTNGSSALTANASLTSGRAVVADGAGSLSTPAEYDAGNSSTAITLDFGANGPAQKVTLTGNCTITLSGGSSGQTYSVRLVQDATGTRTVAWTTAKWPGGFAPVITTGNGVIDLISFYYDGSSYYGTFGQNFS